MKYTLLLLYFISSPAPSEVEDEKRTWMLQSTSVMEFSTKPACIDAGAKVTKAVQQANTVRVRGWCICDPGAGASCPKIRIQKVAPEAGVDIEMVPPRLP